MESSQRLQIGVTSPNKFGLLATKSASLLDLLPGKSLLNSTVSKNYTKYELLIPNADFQNQIKLLDWRVKTDLPIVKVIFYKILPKKTPAENSVVQVSIEHFSSSLQNSPKLCLSQILHYMKAALNGFENLFARFGAFDVNDKMILIDRLAQCRVWCNENLSLNYPSSKQLARNQIEMKRQITKLFEDKCIKSFSSSEFFSAVTKTSKMYETIQFIDLFSKKNKYNVTNKTNLFLEVPLSQQNFNKSMQNLSTFKPPEYHRKKPDFIKNIKKERKQSQPVLVFEYPIEQITDNTDTQLMTSRSQAPKINVFSPCKIAKHDSQDPNQIIPDQISPLKSTIPFSSKPNKRLLKQISNDDFQNFKSVLVSNFKTEHTIISKKLSNDMPEDLLTPKSAITLKKHLAAFCKGDNSPKDKIQPFLNFSLKSLDLRKNLSYQQIRTAKQLTAKTKEEPLLLVPEFLEEKKNETFLKNGWLKRLNSLTNANLRESLQSHFDGNDVLAEDLRCESQKLRFLGQMGGQMNKSIISPD